MAFSTGLVLRLTWPHRIARPNISSVWVDTVDQKMSTCTGIRKLRQTHKSPKKEHFRRDQQDHGQVEAPFRAIDAVQSVPASGIPGLFGHS